MHNLADVLDGGYDGIPPTLRDSTLRDDVKALELRYLGKRETPVSSHRPSVTISYSFTNNIYILLNQYKQAGRTSAE